MAAMLTRESYTVRAKNAVAAGQTDQDSTVVGLAGAGGGDFGHVLWIVCLGTVVDGSQLELQAYGSNSSDGSNPVLLGTTGAITAATSSNKVLLADLRHPIYPYQFVRVKRGSQNAAIDSIVAIRYAHNANPTSFADATVLAALRLTGPAVDPATSRLVPA